MTIGPNGVFYGSIAFGGTGPTAAGAIYKLTPPNSPGGTRTEALIYNFQGGNDGATPNAVTLSLQFRYTKADLLIRFTSQWAETGATIRARRDPLRTARGQTAL